jgi:hypothetical protein
MYVVRTHKRARPSIYFFDSETWQHEWKAVNWKRAWYFSTQKSCKLDCNVNTLMKCGIRDQSASVKRINEFWGNESSEREDLVAVMHDSWVNGFSVEDWWIGWEVTVSGVQHSKTWPKSIVTTKRTNAVTQRADVTLDLQHRWRWKEKARFRDDC